MLQRMRNSYCRKNRIEKSGYGPVKIATVFFLKSPIIPEIIPTKNFTFNQTC